MSPSDTGHPGRRDSRHIGNGERGHQDRGDGRRLGRMRQRGRAASAGRRAQLHGYGTPPPPCASTPTVRKTTARRVPVLSHSPTVVVTLRHPNVQVSAPTVDLVDSCAGSIRVRTREPLPVSPGVCLDRRRTLPQPLTQLRRPSLTHDEPAGEGLVHPGAPRTPTPIVRMASIEGGRLDGH